MRRRGFLYSSSLGAAAFVWRPSTEVQQVTHDLGCWDIAARLADSIDALIEGDDPTDSHRLADELIEFGHACLANLRDEAAAALARVREIGASAWGRLDRSAEDLGLPEFREYRQRTIDFLEVAVEEWRSTGSLPSFRLDRAQVECIFREWRNERGCIEAPARTVGTCLAMALAGLVAGGSGFMAVFGLCLRRRAPGLALSMAMRCVRPVVGRCVLGRT